MEQPRNSDCWYKDTCTDDCNACTVYLQLKWQMDNSGLYPTQQKPISLYIDENNEIDRDAFLRLAEIRKTIVEFVQSSKNLYICGKECGNGKTSWAVKLLQTYFHFTAVGNYDNLKGMFVSVPDLLFKLKDFKNPLPQKYKDNLETVDLIIFDDIAITNSLSQFDYMQLFNIINNRVLAGKSNIFTSNVVEYEKLENILGQRLANRIYKASEIIELKGAGVR